MSATEPGGRPAPRLTPEQVRRAEFTRTPLGRRGYLEEDVVRFREGVADQLAQSDAEKAELRAELDRLRNYFRRQQIDPATALSEAEATASRQRPGDPAELAEPVALAELEIKIDQLRTFADATQGQMRSMVDGLRQHLDRLATP